MAATPDVTFTYTTAGRVLTRTEAGQASTTYVYTAWGQPSKETVTSLANGFAPSEVERTFDANNSSETAAQATDIRFIATRDGEFYSARGDGAGGAVISPGGGLAGLRDRVGTLDGWLGLASPAGGPTVVHVELPIRQG